MIIGDLVYLRPKNSRILEEEYIGLLVDKKFVGHGGDGTYLYDILITETSEVITFSDIYFEIWRVE